MTSGAVVAGGSGHSAYAARKEAKLERVCWSAVLERETGASAPSTKQRVEFVYRLTNGVREGM